MPRPAQIPPPARRESQVAARARLRQSAAAGVGAAGLARGAPASAAASQLAHSASAAAAHPLPDSVRPGAGREPPGRLMGAALRAVADSRAGSAPGLAGARTQAEGGGPPPEVGRRGEPPASPLDGGSVEKPERSGDTSPPTPPHRGLGLGILPGVGLLAGRSHAPAGGMPYPPDLARRLQPGACQAAGPFPAPSHPPPQDWVGSGDQPEGRSTLGQAQCRRWRRLGSPGLAECLRPGDTWATGFLPYDATALAGMA